MGHAKGDTEIRARELAVEQAHVDRVYAELEAAGRRVDLVQADGMARGRTDRTGDVRDEEMTGLFERDALVYSAARRRADLDREHEGLVFGRLDLDHPCHSLATAREIRYVGRLGVRDDDYEPLVIDWRAPAAAPFYRATPTTPMGVIRRRVLRCRGQQVIGAEDDLMVSQAPDDMAVLGEGALLAALTRSRSGRMRDIVATIQAHQDEAIRADARGVVEIAGGPGTGKTVVALHRAAYLLYSDRRRFERGGVLVVGPSAAYTAYIERVLPSLGEDSVLLRSIGDIVDAVTATRTDTPAVAALKGTLAIRRVLARAARDVAPGAPQALRAMVDGRPVHLDRPTLDRIRAQVLRHHHRNSSRDAMLTALAQAAWRQVREGDREEFLDVFHEHRDVERFLHDWWRPVDPREVLLWLADPHRAVRYCAGIFSTDDAHALAASYRTAVATGRWSIADAALIDDLSARLGLVPETTDTERGFYEVELLDDAEDEAIAGGSLRGPSAPRGAAASSAQGYREMSGRAASDLDDQGRRALLLRGRIDQPGSSAHILVDEAQDLSPMQWRMLGRRGRSASWTVVGDAAQASWPDAAEAAAARDDAFGAKTRSAFHMDTNYRNAREIFDYAARIVLPSVPDADIPRAVRETGVDPVETDLPIAHLTGMDAASAVRTAVADAVTALRSEVDGAIGIISPARWCEALACLDEGEDGRVIVVDPLSCKGLEYDATVVVDPDEITAESPGGVRVLYVALTRAAHRMTVLRPR
ncbi:ATP-binding domain-containing protein [Austwickia sp. TVS 96-490-7B]|uniref:HelD family protein n=1 Tax=Austwickia sp. TVS 96-490-7B TaxID=2830843 RepID=UPI002101DB1C|nr:ATP-binding domain-containing protein [Austwickia sp. TVS 96-490-7B]